MEKENKENTPTIMIRLKQNEYNDIKELADKDKRSMSGMTRWIICKYLDELKSK